ncbi:MAG: DNA-3-methyladenine glycosylase [Patescibacteria group bacterium]|nr:DNA-3-methyladenine glycosylase [Patescibacteria group bacterium]
MRLRREFFERRTLTVAREMLGKLVVRKYNNQLLVGKIVEVEAYIGPKDKASHAYSPKVQSLATKLKILNQNWPRIKDYINNRELFFRRIINCSLCKVTSRNLAEYLRGGHIYIYLIYGSYYQLNITSFKEGYPECILIRSLEPIVNLENPRGPGRVCKELRLESNFWGYDLVRGKEIWLEKGTDYSPKEIISKPRIGIDYAGEWAAIPWRFYVKNNSWVSKK